jgi:predicted dehydrogenase
MGWRAERSSGGGALLDLASHHVDLVRFITGSGIAEVKSIIRSIHSEQDSAILQCVTTSGVRSQIHAEYGESFQHAFKVTTPDSTLEIDLAGSHTVDYNGRPSHFPSPARLLHIYRKFRSPAFEPSYEPALIEFLRSAQGGRSVSPDMRDGLLTLEVTAAAESSASSGSPVTIAAA